MLTINQLLRFAAQTKASDLHLSAGEAPSLRIHGEIQRVDVPSLTPEDTHRLIFDVMNDAQRRIFQEKLEVDFAFALDDELRFRVNAFVQNRGEGAVFRSIPHKIPSFSDLNLPPVLRTFAEMEKGLVLVTGPTGSGKSTTLAAMIDHINETTPGHILTLEDPIEFVHKSKRCLVNQREVGTQTHSFNAALKSALREDPDVILVGELRDLETVSLALTAAETGHLVFATVHTSSAPKTVDRLVDVFPTQQQAQIRTMLSESLVGVATQSLLPKIGGGRAAAIEILVATPAVRNLIRENKTFQIPSAMQVGAKSGMVTMEAALMDLVAKGLVSPDDVRHRLPESAEQRSAAAAQGAAR
ncbi:MAG TPA: type IV pilus twitching motility protein PilT [Kofleriaceae bacterium]|nr:type IV pilus twitching motility protein PilT [Kofleriaceae bacterium]